MEPRIAEDTALDTFKQVRKKFYEASNEVFGPGFLSMTEYYFTKKRGYNPFAMLFSEPSVVYEDWVVMFKGEEPIRKLLEKVAGRRYAMLLEDIKRNDGFRVWCLLHSLSGTTNVAA